MAARGWTWSFEIGAEASVNAGGDVFMCVGAVVGYPFHFPFGLASSHEARAGVPTSGASGTLPCLRGVK